MAEILTNGRVLLGVGRGYYTREVEIFGSPTLEEAVARGSWLCGPSEMIVQHLKSVKEQYPAVELINLGSVMGMPMEVFKDQLDKFANGVMRGLPEAAAG